MTRGRGPWSYGVFGLNSSGQKVNRFCHEVELYGQEVERRD